MLVINSLTVDAGSFTFTTSVAAIDSITYVVTANYTHFSSLFKVMGEIEEEEFASIELAISHQEQLVSYARENGKASTKVVKHHLEKCWLVEGQRELSLVYIKQELLLQEVKETEDITEQIYTFREYKVIRRFYDLDVEIKVTLNGIEVYSDLFCFEEGWPAVEEVLLNFIIQ